MGGICVKRLAFLGVIFLMCLLLLTFTVSAEENLLMEAEAEAWGTSMPQIDQITLFGTGTQTTVERLYQAMLRGDAEINISDLNLYYDFGTESAPELNALMNYVIYTKPDLFYVKGWSYSYYASGHIATLKPNYTIAESERRAAKDFYEEKLNYILDQIDDDWSDLEKILFINDYLASHYEYDISVYSNSDTAIRDAYQFFKEGTGVCQAYYIVCKALLDACDIPSTFATSEQANHVWNVVRLNGKWYHLDVTWNDPTSNLLGRARHKYFLLSTAKLLEEDSDRTDWVCGETVSCTDTTYNSYYWSEIDAPFVPLNGNWYYSTSTAICVTDDVTRAGTPVIDHGYWHVPDKPGYVWNGAFSGLGTYKGWLIYNTENNVMGYDPLTGSTYTFYTLNDTTRRIFGAEITGNKVICETDVHPGCSLSAPCSKNLEVEASLSYLDSLYDKSYAGVGVSEENGTVTIEGTPDSRKPFCIIAVGYNANGKLCDRKMIWSTELESTTTQWQLEGKTVKLFMLTKDLYLPVG